MLREAVALLPDAIRFSETFDVPATDLMRVVREKGLEGVVAKRRGSTYQTGKRSDDWVKVRANRVEEFVIGGYVPTARSFEAILVGRYEGRRLMYVGSVRAGFVTSPGAHCWPNWRASTCRDVHLRICRIARRAAGAQVLPRRGWSSAAGSGLGSSQR